MISGIEQFQVIMNYRLAVRTDGRSEREDHWRRSVRALRFQGFVLLHGYCR